MSLVHHRRLGAASYGSIALLKPSSNAATLSKTRMAVRATPIGVTSFEFPAPKADGGSGGEAADFVTWAFTRNPAHCATLGEAVDGCTVVQEHEAARDGYLTYCERVYLNPATATGPDWADLLPARLFHLDLAAAPRRAHAHEPPVWPRLQLPPSAPVPTYPGEPLRFLHIIKTGGAQPCP